MANHTITGWDIGGAHLKVARIDHGGRLLYVEQFAAPLWQGPDVLDDVLATVRDRLGREATRHVITMTGELADCFSDRRSGVLAILEHFCRCFPAEQSRVYAGAAGLVAVGEAEAHCERIASANWLATAEYLAGRYRDGLLVDIGSTTTDIIPFSKGRPVPEGSTDHTRLQSGELVYTGIVRTPVMAVAGRAPFRGRWQGLAAEVFATMADVYRLTGQLPDRHDSLDTPDGAGKRPVDSRRRLARMLGLDLDDAVPEEAWTELAEYIAAQQLGMISEAINHIAAVQGDESPLLIGAGCGRFLVPELARETGGRWEDFAAHLDTDTGYGARAADNAAAVAVALLGLGKTA